MPANDPLNPFQIAAAKSYGGGDFAYISDIPKGEAPEHYNDCGDTLFTFIMRELADDGDAMSGETARQRMQNAIRDLQTVIDALPE